MRWGACGRIWLHWRWRWRLSCRCRGCRLALLKNVSVGRALPFSSYFGSSCRQRDDYDDPTPNRLAEVQLLRDGAGTGDRACAAADHRTSDDPDRAADRTDGRATGLTDGCSAKVRISYGVRTTVVVVVGVA
jgi:hypothetical protein